MSDIEATTTSPAALNNGPVTVTDKRGRSIVIKPVSAREQFRMMKYLGGTNETYMGMAVMAASVQQIDGTPMPGAQDEKTLDIAFNLLGDEGWAAVQQHYASLVPAEDAEKVMGEAKN